MEENSNAITLEQQRNILIEEFQREDPELFTQFEIISAACALSQPISVEISIREDTTNGKP